MKKIFLILCLFYAYLNGSLIESHNIDTSKKGIALGTYVSLNRATILANKFPNYDIYIKQTTTTKKPYFVVFAVNIEKKDQKSILKNIKKQLPSAYITSDSRVRQLHTDNTVKVTVLDSTIEKTQVINIAEPKIDKSYFIDKDKQAVTVKYTKSKDNAIKIASKLQEFDIYIKKSTINESRMIYVVNIENGTLQEVLKDIRKTFPDAFETSKKRIKKLLQKNNLKDIFVKSENKKIFTASTSPQINIKPKPVKEQSLANKKENKTKNKTDDYNYAKALFREKRYEEALVILKELSESYPQNANINFYLGRSYFEVKNFEQALAAFERVLFTDETNHRARLELALTQKNLKLNKDALENFNMVLKENIPPNVKKNIKKQIAYLNSLKQRHFFSGAVTLGIAHDSNINNSSNKDYPLNNNGVETLVSADPSYYDIYRTMGIEGNYIYKIDEKTALHNKFSYTKISYEKDDKRIKDKFSTIAIEKEDKKVLDVKSYSIYYSKYFPKDIISAGFDFSNIKLAGKSYMTTDGVGINYQKNYYSKIQFFSALKYFKKEYKQSDDLNLDSDNIQLLLGQHMPTLKYGDINLIYLFTQEKKTHPDILGTDNHTADKRKNGIIVSNKYKLTKTLDLNSMAMYTYEKRNSIEEPFLKIREDKQSSLSVGLTYKLNKTLSLSSNIKHVGNRSTLNAYDYEKQTLDFQLRQAF